MSLVGTANHRRRADPVGERPGNHYARKVRAVHYPIHILVVVGAGGHSAQCLRLLDFMADENYRYSYVLENEDMITEHQIRIPGPVYRIPRPSSVINRRVVPDTLKFVWCSLRAAFILMRLRPAAIVSVGPAVAVPVSLIGKLLCRKIIYIESASRTQSLSLTGRIMGHLADLFFVQWEEVLRVAPRHAIYAGRLL